MTLASDGSIDANGLALLVAAENGDTTGFLYRELADDLMRAISRSGLPPGTKLPAERALARELGISRVTVAGAYRLLREDGWIDSRRGAGTFITGRRREEQPWGTMLGSASPDAMELINAAPRITPAVREAYAIGMAATDLDSVGYQPGGSYAIRSAIADRFTARGVPTRPDNILVTAGASDAVHTVLESYVAPGDRVICEHPTYPGLLEEIRAVGGVAVPVPIDPLHPEAFVDAVARAARQSAPTVAFLIPDFANPTGTLLPNDVRRRLAATLIRYGILAVIDEVSTELSIDDLDAPIEPFGAATPEGTTISLGGLSKVAWGGLRIGWVRADVGAIGRLTDGYQRRQLSVSAVDQQVAVAVFADLDRIREQRRDYLRIRRDRLVTDLSALLPRWEFVIPTGGMSLWCRLPNGLSSTMVVEQAAQRGLRLAAGTRFGTGYDFDDHLRLPFVRSPEELAAAVGLLAGAAPVAPRRPAARTPAAMVI